MNNEALSLVLTVVFEAAPEGGFTCHFEEWPEGFSEGDTKEEARANLFDALNEVMEFHRSESRIASAPDALRESIQLTAA